MEKLCSLYDLSNSSKFYLLSTSGDCLSFNVCLWCYFLKSKDEGSSSIGLFWAAFGQIWTVDFPLQISLCLFNLSSFTEVFSMEKQDFIFKSMAAFSNYSVCVSVSGFSLLGNWDLNLIYWSSNQKDTNLPCQLALLHSTNCWY